MAYYSDWLFWFSLRIYMVTTALHVILVLFRLPDNRTLKVLSGTTLYAAFLGHTVSLVLRAVAAEHLPVKGLFETMNFYSWTIVFLYILVIVRHDKPVMGAFVLPIAFAIQLFSSKAPMHLTPLLPALKTIWFEIHVITAFGGYAFFAFGFSMAVMWLMRKPLENYLMDKKGCYPDKDTLDELSYQVIAWGYVAFSISMVSGGIWAFLAWKDYWVWTPKEMWSSIIWIYYTFYLHTRYTRGWQGKRANWMAVIGYGIVLFTYFGISLLFQSSHPL